MAKAAKAAIRIPARLYLGDNGRALCRDHLGVTAQYSGRDLSGQRIVPVTTLMRAIAKHKGVALVCEQCGASGERVTP